MPPHTAPVAARGSTARPPAAARALPAGMRYLGGIDGLRALAVLAVLGYHAELGWLPGGFLGVEVFFVVSGYLITSVLLSGWRSSGHVDVRTFWLHRARRLLPALAVLLAAVTAVAVVFLPGEVASLRGDVLSALAYVTNWTFVVGHKSYFETLGRPSLVQHLWSLAVEEQFYLVWPLAFGLGMRHLGRRGLLRLVVVGIVASSALMWLLHTPGSDPSRVYYGTDTRAAGLLVGCALAFVWSPWRLQRQVGRAAPLLLDGVGVIALALLARMLFVTDEFADSLYRGGFLRVSLVTAVVIAVVAHPVARLGRILGMRPLRWVGLRSYGIYLWHWPVFVLTRPGIDVGFDGPLLFTLRVGVTFVLAALSYRFVEVPVRTGAVGRWRTAWGTMTAEERRRRKARVLGVAMASVLAVAGLGIAVARAHRPPPPTYLTLADGTTTEGFNPSRPVDLEPGTTDATVTATALVGTTATTAVPDTTTPTTSAPTTTTTTAPVQGAGALGTAGRPVTTKRVVAIGDSVMLGAAVQLKALGPDVSVDAVVGRQVSQGIDDLRYRQAVGLLGDVVVIHLGNNGTFTDAQFDQLMAPLADVPKVIFVNVKVPRRWEADANAVVANGVVRYPNTVMIDWYTIGQSQAGVFYDDGMHLRPPGADLYAQAVASML